MKFSKSQAQKRKVLEDIFMPKQNSKGCPGKGTSILLPGIKK